MHDRAVEQLGMGALSAALCAAGERWTGAQARLQQLKQHLRRRSPAPPCPALPRPAPRRPAPQHITA